ncbi:hypothetical protein UUU_38540 [Klebsiella pneumoniae subsp. pneumoniae DSM 30104 = JCM 1662 = NBRC 14940]|nr:hypothetical protein UUU_38540 [Klebsiella pneumoniae subsp. pneumoniae DSM 30104 = JCM 1662 = NBRC 14940]
MKSCLPLVQTSALSSALSSPAQLSLIYPTTIPVIIDD